MKEKTKAYMAGLVDAEGCLTIAEGTSLEYNTPHYEPCLTVTNISKPLSLWLVKHFGGTCSWKKVYQTNSRPWFIWKPESYKHGNRVLSLISPYLVIKQKEAVILQEFYGMFRQENPEKRAELCREIKSLKDRESVTTSTPNFVNWKENLVNAYFAGFFDGEGSICVCKNNNPSLALKVGLENTYYPIIESLQTRFGGKIYDRGRRKAGYQNIHSWNLRKKTDLEQMMLCFLPYLIIKREQAKIALRVTRNQTTLQEARTKISFLNTNKIESGLIGDDKSAAVQKQSA